MMMFEVFEMIMEDPQEAKEFAEMTDVLKGINGYTKKLFDAL